MFVYRRWIYTYYCTAMSTNAYADFSSCWRDQWHGTWNYY
jgi:hypothetical protein